MDKQSNLNLAIILLFSIILLLSVYVVLSQEDNLTDNNLLISDDNSHQEIDHLSVNNTVLNTEINLDDNTDLQMDYINQQNNTNQTNSSTNESSSLTIIEDTIEENVLPEENNIVNEILENGKVIASTKELLKSSKDDDIKNFIIKYDSDFKSSGLEQFSNVKNIPEIGVSKFEAKISDMKGILDDSSVEYIEINQNLNLLEDTTPWNVERIGAAYVWNFSSGSGVKVAILDTGISEHDDLLIAGGWNIIDNSSDYIDNQGHGTAVAGVLGAVLNDEGLVGVSPEASIYAIKIMESGSGQLSDAIAGVQWAINSNMDIISMSFGFDEYSQIFKEVLQDAYDDGILIIGASGNDGTEGVVYPAAYDKVIAVGATDEDDNIASFSNYGPELELVAPGVDINSTGLGEKDYTLGSGTSLAVPHVAGVAALIWAYNQSLSNIEVRGKLQNDALDLGNPGKDYYYGYGLVRINLSSDNYNYSELAYYYEVYNISHYGMENENYTFWLSGNGTIDDVNFSEGYYLVNKTINGSVISQKIYVDENRIVIPLLYYPVYVHYIDNYSTEGNTTDNIAWIKGRLDMYLDYTNNTDYIYGECYRYRDWPFYYETCYFQDGDGYDRETCDDDYDLVNCDSYSECTDDVEPGSQHDYINTSTTQAYTGDFAASHYFVHCGTASSADYPTDDNPKPVYVIDKKRFHCLNATHYTYQGWHGSGWVNYAGGVCIGTCNDAGALNYTNSTDVVPNPCLNSSTDLAIVDIVPIQVVSTTELVNRKTTLIRVFVLNNGSFSVNGQVKLSLNTDIMNAFSEVNSSIKTINSNETEYFDLYFIPKKEAMNANISVEVEIYGE